MGEFELFKPENENENACFAAANTGGGFVSFYGEIFGDNSIVRRYLIKGGPGTGKSSFMRFLSERFSEEGRKIEYYRCSSDPSSLDAIVIDKRIALIDSTAPHAMEPELAGAKDEIVNLGQFWNSRELFLRRDLIAELGEKKKEAYAGAYRFLEGALALDKRSRELCAKLLKCEKMRRAAARICAEIPRGERYRLSVGLCNCIGMSGSKHLDFYEKNATRLYVIDDFFGAGNAFLAYIAEIARERANAIRVSYDPLNVDLLDALLFEESRVAFVVQGAKTTNEACQDAQAKITHINMRRFIQTSAFGEDQKSKKREFKADRRLRDGLIESAKECLAEAGRAHFELERIYGECMDFESLGRFKEEFLKKIKEEFSSL